MFIRIEPSSLSPIYRQIMDQIRHQIAAGMLKAGDRLHILDLSEKLRSLTR